MGTAEGDGELVADFAAECLWLGKADVMGVGRDRATDKAALRGNMAEMVLVAKAPGFAEGERALVDPVAKLGDSDAAEPGSVDQGRRLRYVRSRGCWEGWQRTNRGFPGRVVAVR